jgi:type II secretory pathway predicted ATPase ExeA
MLKLKGLLRYHNLSQADMARGINLSDSTVAQLVNHELWPRSIRRIDLEQRIVNWLASLEIDGMQIVGIFEKDEGEARKKNIRVVRCARRPECFYANNEETFDMLLRKQTLTTQAKQAFGLLRDPFGDPRSSAELFVSPEIRYVRENLYQVTRYGTFLAIVGESGSGKSTIRKDLHVRLQTEAKPVTVIEPYILGMEDNDSRGKTLKASAIAEAIMAAVAPGTTVPVSHERRFRAVHTALRESHRMGNRHVLIIEEAHSLPIPTLKHLKRFFELEEGFEKLLSIVLIGQPELGHKLAENRAEVREVVQRCEIVRLNPLGEQLAAYLKHRFALIDKPLDDVMDDAAIESVRNRLTGHSPATKDTFSVLYPLAVHNLVTAALNLAASVGAPKLSADIVGEV